MRQSAGLSRFFRGKKFWFGIICWSIIFTFTGEIIGIDVLRVRSAYAQDVTMPAPGTFLPNSPAYSLPVLRGISIPPQDPFKINFLIDSADNSSIDKEEINRLTKYFLTFLTIPEEDLWVNLSPNEADRIIKEDLATTIVGRDMLIQDYILKHLAASLTNPDQEPGLTFWREVLTKAREKYGRDVPVDVFTKVWIVPEKAVVYEQEGEAFIAESRLKVMLEDDYLSMKRKADTGETTTNDKDNKLSAAIAREIIIPELEREVNEGKYFAPLRQMFHSLILAIWFKRRLKQNLVNKIYVDQKKVSGVTVDEKDIKEKIYEQYMQAIKKGVYNYIRSDLAVQNAFSGQRRQYFSGGINFSSSQESRGQSSATMTNFRGGDWCQFQPLSPQSFLGRVNHWAQERLSISGNGKGRFIYATIVLIAMGLPSATLVANAVRTENNKKYERVVDPNRFRSAAAEGLGMGLDIARRPAAAGNSIVIVPKSVEPNAAPAFDAPSVRVNANGISFSGQVPYMFGEGDDAKDNKEIEQEKLRLEIGGVVSNFDQTKSEYKEGDEILTVTDEDTESQLRNKQGQLGRKKSELEARKAVIGSTPLQIQSAEIEVANLQREVASLKTKSPIRVVKAPHTFLVVTRNSDISNRRNVPAGTPIFLQVERRDVVRFSLKFPANATDFTQIGKIAINGMGIKGWSAAIWRLSPHAEHAIVSFTVVLPQGLPPNQSTIRVEIRPSSAPSKKENRMRSLADRQPASATTISRVNQIEDEAISAPEGGRVTFFVDEGVRVSRGQLLAEIEYDQRSLVPPPQFEEYQETVKACNAVQAQLNIMAQGKEYYNLEQINYYQNLRDRLLNRITELSEQMGRLQVLADYDGIITHRNPSMMVGKGNVLFRVKTGQVWIGGPNSGRDAILIPLTVKVKDRDPVLIETPSGEVLPGRVVGMPNKNPTSDKINLKDYQAIQVKVEDPNYSLGKGLPVRVIMLSDNRSKGGVGKYFDELEKRRMTKYTLEPRWVPPAATTAAQPVVASSSQAPPCSGDDCLLNQTPVQGEKVNFATLSNEVAGNNLLVGPYQIEVEQKQAAEKLPQRKRLSLEGGVMVSNGRLSFSGGFGATINGIIGGISTGNAIGAALPLVSQLAGSIIDQISGKPKKERILAENMTEIARHHMKAKVAEQILGVEKLLIQIAEIQQEIPLQTRLQNEQKKALAFIEEEMRAGIKTIDDRQKVAAELNRTSREIVRLEAEERRLTNQLNHVRGVGGSAPGRISPEISWSRNFLAPSKDNEEKMLGQLIAADSPNHDLAEAKAAQTAVKRTVALQNQKFLPMVDLTGLFTNKDVTDSLYDLTPGSKIRTGETVPGANIAVHGQITIFDTGKKPEQNIIAGQLKKAELHVEGVRVQIQLEFKQAMERLESLSTEIQQAQIYYNDVRGKWLRDAASGQIPPDQLAERLKPVMGAKKDLLESQKEYFQLEAELRKLGVLENNASFSQDIPNSQGAGQTDVLSTERVTSVSRALPADMAQPLLIVPDHFTDVFKIVPMTSGGSFSPGTIVFEGGEDGISRTELWLRMRQGTPLPTGPSPNPPKVKGGSAFLGGPSVNSWSAQIGNPDFNERRSYEMHPGEDYPTPTRTEVRAEFDGVVKFWSQEPGGSVPFRNYERNDGTAGYGYYVTVTDTTSSTEFRAAHLSRFNIMGVDPSGELVDGQIVIRGQLLGYSGGERGARGAGNSKRPHVHAEVRINNQKMDPKIYLKDAYLATQTRRTPSPVAEAFGRDTVDRQHVSMVPVRGTANLPEEETILQDSASAPENIRIKLIGQQRDWAPDGQTQVKKNEPGDRELNIWAALLYDSDPFNRADALGRVGEFQGRPLFANKVEDIVLSNCSVEVRQRLLNHMATTLTGGVPFFVRVVDRAINEKKPEVAALALQSLKDVFIIHPDILKDTGGLDERKVLLTESAGAGIRPVSLEMARRVMVIFLLWDPDKVLTDKLLRSNYWNPDQLAQIYLKLKEYGANESDPYHAEFQQLAGYVHNVIIRKEAQRNVKELFRPGSIGSFKDIDKLIWQDDFYSSFLIEQRKEANREFLEIAPREKDLGAFLSPDLWKTTQSGVERLYARNKGKDPLLPPALTIPPPAKASESLIHFTDYMGLEDQETYLEDIKDNPAELARIFVTPNIMQGKAMEFLMSTLEGRLLVLQIYRDSSDEKILKLTEAQSGNFQRDLKDDISSVKDPATADMLRDALVKLHDRTKQEWPLNLSLAMIPVSELHQASDPRGKDVVEAQILVRATQMAVDYFEAEADGFRWWEVFRRGPVFSKDERRLIDQLRIMDELRQEISKHDDPREFLAFLAEKGQDPDLKEFMKKFIELRDKFAQDIKTNNQQLPVVRKSFKYIVGGILTVALTFFLGLVGFRIKRRLSGASKLRDTLVDDLIQEQNGNNGNRNGNTLINGYDGETENGEAFPPQLEAQNIKVIFIPEKKLAKRHRAALLRWRAGILQLESGDLPADDAFLVLNNICNFAHEIMLSTKYDPQVMWHGGENYEIFNNSNALLYSAILTVDTLAALEYYLRNSHNMSSPLEQRRLLHYRDILLSRLQYTELYIGILGDRQTIEKMLSYQFASGDWIERLLIYPTIRLFISYGPLKVISLKRQRSTLPDLLALGNELIPGLYPNPQGLIGKDRELSQHITKEAIPLTSLGPNSAQDAHKWRSFMGRLMLLFGPIMIIGSFILIVLGIMYAGAQVSIIGLFTMGIGFVIFWTASLRILVTPWGEEIKLLSKKLNDRIGERLGQVEVKSAKDLKQEADALARLEAQETIQGELNAERPTVNKFLIVPAEGVSAGILRGSVNDLRGRLFRNDVSIGVMDARDHGGSGNAYLNSVQQLSQLGFDDDRATIVLASTTNYDRLQAAIITALDNACPGEGCRSDHVAEHQILYMRDPFPGVIPGQPHDDHDIELIGQWVNEGELEEGQLGLLDIEWNADGNAQVVQILKRLNFATLRERSRGKTLLLRERGYDLANYDAKQYIALLGAIKFGPRVVSIIQRLVKTHEFAALQKDLTYLDMKLDILNVLLRKDSDEVVAYLNKRLTFDDIYENYTTAIDEAVTDESDRRTRVSERMRPAFMRFYMTLFRLKHDLQDFKVYATIPHPDIGTLHGLEEARGVEGNGNISGGGSRVIPISSRRVSPDPVTSGRQGRSHESLIQPDGEKDETAGSDEAVGGLDLSEAQQRINFIKIKEKSRDLPTGVSDIPPINLESFSGFQFQVLQYQLIFNLVEFFKK